jgi:hypothetical protein
MHRKRGHHSINRMQAVQSAGPVLLVHCWITPRSDCAVALDNHSTVYLTTSTRL